MSLWTRGGKQVRIDCQGSRPTLTVTAESFLSPKAPSTRIPTFLKLHVFLPGFVWTGFNRLSKGNLAAFVLTEGRFV